MAEQEDKEGKRPDRLCRPRDCLHQRSLSGNYVPGRASRQFTC